MWLVLGGLGGAFAQRFQDMQKNEESSFLPGSSESVRELMLAKRFPSGERFAAITMIRRDGGLKSGDLAAIERTRASLAANPPGTGFRQALVRVSPDRTTALVIVNLDPHGKEILLKSSASTVDSCVARLRSRGLTVKVTGPRGILARPCQRIRLDQRDAAACHRHVGVRAPDPDLPLPDPLAGPGS